MSTVTVQIACDRPFFASIGDVVLGGRAEPFSIDLPQGAHELVWAVIGGRGGAFRATISQGARTLCSVADWKVPVTGGWCGDLAAFNV